LVEWVRRAAEPKQEEVAFKELDQLRREHPDNAVILAAYCFAFDIGDYKIRRSRRSREKTEQENADFQAALQRAKSLKPDLWLIHAVEAHRLIYLPPWQIETRLKKMQKMAQLAPDVAFAHYLMAEAYIMATSNQPRLQNGCELAARELEQTLKLKPAFADAAFSLFQIYDLWRSDKQRAARAKRMFLNSLPKGHNIRKSVQKRLNLY
jgi:hypothetical protein